MAKEKIETIYFGGGTPSVLEEQELNEIFESIHRSYSVNDDAEITLEANPDDLSSEKLTVLKNSGINRLSIGLQTFNEEELKWMNRTHTVEESERCVKLAQEKGFNNITVDLIYGSRFQTLTSWENSLKKIETMNVQHLSCYNLTVEEKTELGVKVNRGKESDTNEELSMQQFEMLMNWSDVSGFKQYEISNFAKEGFHSRHNSSYWIGKNYAGFGPSAHSYNGNSRQWNISNNQLYIRNIADGKEFFESEMLDERMKLNEYLLTSLRTSWGLDLSFLKEKFSGKYLFPVEKGIQIEKERGNLVQSGSIITLTREGKFLADEITRNLMV